MAEIEIKGTLPTPDKLFLVKVIGMNPKKWCNENGTIKSKYLPTDRYGGLKMRFNEDNNYYRYTDFPRKYKYAILAPPKNDADSDYSYEKIRELSKTEQELSSWFFSSAFIGALSLGEMGQKFDEEIRKFEKRAAENLEVVKRLKELREEIKDLIKAI